VIAGGWRILAIRGPGSALGPATKWAKRDGEVFEGTEEEARTLAREWNDRVSSPHVHYVPKAVAEEALS
jgi:hypothetical protein